MRQEAKRLRFALMLVALWTVWRPAECHSQTAGSTSPAKGVLVLQNGNVVSGVIELVGDRYRVLLDQGEIGIAARHVRLRAATLPQAYAALRSQRRNTTDGHLELAEWCLQQNLFPQAADELLGAMRHDPKRPEIVALRRRLEARARAASVRGRPAAAGTADSPAAAPAARTPARIESAVAESKSPRLADQPDVLAEEFRDVARVLLNGCAANRCHGNAAGGGLELFRSIHRQTISRRVLERNWELVVQRIDAAAPEKSLLLQMALTAHGGAGEPPLREEDEQFQQLRSWTHRQAAALFNGRDAEATRRHLAGHDEQRRHGGQGEDAVEAKVRSAVTDREAAPAGGPRKEADATDAADVDPFDPAPFNAAQRPSSAVR